ncbi:DUF1501 domain-containing protein [Xinfangfangia sp. CPCC 101601]|uniref:DUF1501 domain-containing protein n=1 Tax=Pseudogemmobacter lacusdianii TaxID=3069608 RepID=A0ABU0VXW5_9RHOB|nr:DUF1501 domain-containing protein [Xinfangfangia sp. CPCC 101601]MDQ2066586.1 DUF1501 domain-containing protein [Xinfangfangia sp. CPCC 101601]
MAGILLSRRDFLIGCSAAAAPILTPMTFAAAPGENRLVVIVLRGAMDGLDLLRPLGDPDFARLRPKLAQNAEEQSLPLNGFFGLHPACAPLMPLWQAGELSFATAVATPYRSRSHFDGQDALETGSGEASGAATLARDGWLNRALQVTPGAQSLGAVTVGVEPMLILEGKARVQHWYPVADSRMSPQGLDLLGDLYDESPDLSPTYAEAQLLRGETEAASGNSGEKALGGYVAERLRGEARIATFSFSGWDTHHRQEYHMGKRLAAFSEMLLSLREGLGADWARTSVIALTEFGRTVAENGSGGTDHGTGGVALLAGGAIRGGQIMGDWPGLDEADLLARRDLMPTADVRGYAGALLHEMFGLALSDIEGQVFPGLNLPQTLQLVR